MDMELTDSERNLKKSQILSLSKSRGRKLICDNMDRLINATEKELFTVDPASNEVKYTEHDMLRRERNFWINVKKFPHMISNQYSPIEKNDMNDLV